MLSFSAGKGSRSEIKEINIRSRNIFYDFRYLPNGLMSYADVKAKIHHRTIRA